MEDGGNFHPHNSFNARDRWKMTLCIMTKLKTYSENGWKSI